MSIVLQSTGGGSVTINEPTTASNFTQNLPAATGTVSLTSDVIGVGQTWQNPSRAIGTTYTNSTGKPIMVAVSYTNSAGSSVQGLIINSATVYAGGVQVAGTGSGFALIVPNGATYVTISNVGTMTLVSWAELR